MLTVKIIRHSERLDFSRPLYWLFCFGHYWADPPLTNNGHKLAKEKATNLIEDGFKPTHIYTSPYIRTMETATEIKSAFSHSEIIIEPLLSEYQPYYKHTINLYPEGITTTHNGNKTEFSYPETYEKFAERIQYIINSLIEKHETDLIMVTHGEVLKVFINKLLEQYPNLLLDPGTTPYLTTLIFSFNKATNQIDINSIRLE